MEEKFQGSVCGGNWWNSSRNLFGSSPCSSAINEFGWFNHAAVRSLSHNSATIASDSDGGVILQDVQNPTFLTSDDWNNQELIHGNERSQDYSQIVEAVTGQNSSMNYRSDEWNFIPDSSINSFPLNSASYSYTSSLLQNLFDADSQAQQCLLDNQSMNYPSSPMNSTEFLPKPFWNATAAASGGASFVPSSLSKFKISPNNVNVKGGGTDKKVGNEAAFKRQRIETPSPLPTFKVRKEKLGDRVTALQQLVSPFGKTDTASVLHEAIEYIKLLHDQVAVLSTPYMKHGCPPLQHQQACDNIKNQEEPMKDLRSRGLCLVPISSTFPVAPADFWTPTFGGSFRKSMGERKQKEDRLSISWAISSCKLGND